MNNFVNLHNHSNFSTLDGFSQVQKMAERAKELNQPAIAITDHGTLAGCYKFYEACIENNVKPILGIEAYLVEEYENKKRYHITLLAQNNDGWKNLLKLHKISWENFYYKPRISFKDLFNHKEGLIVLTGCWDGILAKHIREMDGEKTEQNLRLFIDNFGENLYIEVMDHGVEDQKELNNNLRILAKKYNLKCVNTNDSHYTIKSHAVYQDYLVCDNLKQTITENRKMSLPNDEFYIKSREEMFGLPEELDVTVEIADKCNIDLSTKGFFLPAIEDEYEKFVSIINKGLHDKNLQNNETYRDRLREELKVIKKAGLIGYFLTVYDYIDYAKHNNILVGPGRGSVGGCLIGYLMGIHDVDPIKHKLLFSRFYNAGRLKSLPDIDIDFPENKIDSVKSYVQNKYGKENTALIGTYTYLHKKSALKLICRVLGVDFETSNYYSKIIEDDKETEKLCQLNNSFREIVEKVKQFEGTVTHSSIHAAGMVISPIKLEELVPVRIEGDFYVSSWDMKDIEKIGLVKFDFLSLNTLDVINDVLTAKNMSLSDIPHDNNDTFNLISTTNNIGIFQLSSSGISSLANSVKVNSIDDIAVLVALYRPGPISSGLHIKYSNRKHGIEPVEYAHPLLESVLKSTYGIFVYQEQIIQAVMTLAGFSETEADALRKAIGKKIPELMKKQKQKFIKGCEQNKIEKELAEKIWAEIEEFAEYSFCSAHSVGYAYISYYTAYLKSHYPVEFMAALLNNNYNDATKLSTYLLECENLKIEVVPPSLKYSNYNFIAKDKIYFGLKGINGIGEKTAMEICKHTYSDFEDFCTKYQPSSDVLVAMAEAGVFDEFGMKRNVIIQSAKNIVKVLAQKKDINVKARSLFKSQTNFELAQVEELPQEILAAKEYERLNTYLSYNPIKGVDLYTPDELFGDIYIEGFLVDIKEHVTKKKATMGILTVATKLGRLEALIFPKLYSEKRNSLRKNTYISIRGRYEDKLLISNIWMKQ